MEFSRIWQQAWKDDAPDDSKPTEKTSSKLKIKHGDCTTSWGYTNEKFSMSAVGKLLDSDGYKSDLSGGFEAKYLK